MPYERKRTKDWNYATYTEDYENLGKTAQNLRDKLSHLEKTCKVNPLRITNEIQTQRETEEQSGQDNGEPEVETQRSEQQQQQTNRTSETTPAWTNDDLKLITQITEIAKVIFDDIVQVTGNMSKRDINTFIKKNIFIKKIDVDRLQYTAKSLIKSSPLTDPLQYLWEYNCSIYAVVKAWKSIHSKEKNVAKEVNKSKPHWMTTIERKMDRIRKQISQVSEEIKRLRENRKLTPKMKKNRSWMMKEIKRKITIESLTTLKESKLNTIRALKRQKENKNTAYERFKTNQWFDTDQGSFYSRRQKNRTIVGGASFMRSTMANILSIS